MSDDLNTITTGYEYLGAASNGWSCPQCRTWVPFGVEHSCRSVQATQLSTEERIAAALERIASALERTT